MVARAAPRVIISNAVAAARSRHPRAHLEASVDSFLRTFVNNDLEARLSLFASDVIMDDPVGVRTASNLAELRTFFSNVPFSILFRPMRQIVTGDEVILVSTLALDNEAGQLELDTVTHFRFNAEGLIDELRIFFDEFSLATGG